jgi:2-methylisocitrate lyase-like PEP mutase family enzyme
VAAQLRGVRPLMVNMVDGGDTPPVPHDTLREMGFRLVIFPGGIVRALARTAQAYYRSLAAHRSNMPFADRMFDFAGLNALIGTPEMLALGRSYEGGTT